MTGFSHSPLRIKNKGVLDPPVYLHGLRPTPRHLHWLPLMVLVTKTELTTTVASKSPKTAFFGEEERMMAKGHEQADRRE